MPLCQLRATCEGLCVNDSLEFAPLKEKDRDSFSIGVADVDPPPFCKSEHPCVHLDFSLCSLALCFAVNTFKGFCFFPWLAQAGVPSKPGVPKEAEDSKNSVQWEKADDNGSNLTYYILESR